MDPDPLIDRLLSAARRAPVGDGVPYAFEKRIMACIRQSGIADPLFVWARAWWRVVPVSLAVGVLSFALHALRPPVEELSLQACFEDAVIQSADFFNDAW